MIAFCDSDNALSCNKSILYSYSDAIEKLQCSGKISLEDVSKLSYLDMEKFCNEIKRWRVYGRNDPKQLLTVINNF
jgi:predicted HTH domain antitoxin